MNHQQCLQKAASVPNVPPVFGHISERSVCLSAPSLHIYFRGSPLEDEARLPLYFCGQKPLRSRLMEQKHLYKDTCGLVGICVKKKIFLKHFCNGTDVTAQIISHMGTLEYLFSLSLSFLSLSVSLSVR